MLLGDRALVTRTPETPGEVSAGTFYAGVVRRKVERRRCSRTGGSRNPKPKRRCTGGTAGKHLVYKIEPALRIIVVTLAVAAAGLCSGSSSPTVRVVMKSGI